MDDIIRWVRHRHGDQGRGTPDLILEVGKPLPSFYQDGRRPGLVVKTITGSNPVRCVLNDGDTIFIGPDKVVEIKRGE